jgi:hypothetical protein
MSSSSLLRNLHIAYLLDSIPVVLFLPQNQTSLFILDFQDDLKGLKVQCRRIQRKSKLPQKCLVSAEDEAVIERYDAMYNTYEVCSWDKKLVQGTVNARLIQILSKAGVSELNSFRSL